MRKKLVLLAAFCVAGLTLAAIAAGSTRMAPVEFHSVLNAGLEVPHPTGAMSGANGKFTASLTGSKLKWTLSFAHLTGAASAAHIHAGKKGVAGAVIVPLCGPCKSGVSGTATVTSAQIAAMKKGTTYVNVHTAKNPNGEIRGQITLGM